MKKCFNAFFLLIFLTGLWNSPVSAGPSSSLRAEDSPPPKMVGLPGTHQNELGCPGDWTPGCEQTLLSYDAEDDVWQGEFQIAPGNDDDKMGPRYKIALNGTWDENYGKNAARGGADIPLVVSAPTLVKFYYDHKTHWVADNFNTPILTAIGDFQQALGCANNADAACLRSWLQDPDGDGLFTFATRSLKAGTYSVGVAQNEDSASLLAQPQTFTVKKDGDEIYFGYDTVKNEFTLSADGAPRGNLAKLKAHWVRRDLILWNTVGSPKYTYSLFYSPEAALTLTADGVSGGAEIPLEYLKAGADAEIKAKFPQLAAFTAFRLPPQSPETLAEILQAQIAVIVRDENGKVVDVTGVQLPGVLDDLFAYDGNLGVTFEGDSPRLSLWAPTAKSVSLMLFAAPGDSSPAATLPLKREPASGVWTLMGEPAWAGKFYLYQVQVYVPSTGKIETNLVTDPYSLALSTNSQKSQIVNLADPALQPADWNSTPLPTLAAPEDIVIYELHLRDFSISDASVPENLRGTYLAFTVQNSNGMTHLRELAQAGLTHIHLLPVFDIASVNEDKSIWQTVDEAALAALPPDSEQQVTAVSAISGVDGFNWGYDPYHYTVPEGSYATDPQGAARTLEFRQMVQALNQNGLRVVMDVVYNHTNASGQDEKSVLDKIVPGYYHRLNDEGKVESSTCCSNTASEHAMMRKLMVDSVLTWARDYKVDGFRFDLMGHHMLADMQAVRAALDALTLEKDGVDGKSIYIYGEGWNFGEVANNARGVNATQQNIGGTGIGVFNDRLRDAARGGGPFGDPREQGFATGLFFQSNGAENRSAEMQKSKLLDYGDWIRISLAGNLADYAITRANGDTVPARLVLYNGAAAGYTRDPQENIVYVSAHDNETLWDAIQIKAPENASLQERVRMNNLALSLVAFSQGVPFFHAGDDLLRSKSLDRNSYNSGDWFNKLDWTLETNNWGVGLPGEGRDKWDIFRPLLANPALKAGQAEIRFAAAVFQEYLKIRKSSPLFRLQTAEQVQQSVAFLNTGPQQIPGLIVMRLTDPAKRDPNFDEIIVLFNANPQSMRFSAAELAGKKFELHPVQAASADETVRRADFDSGSATFSVPGRTTAVFVLRKTPPINPLWTALALLAGLFAAAWWRGRQGL
ncbi:MAG: pullulanase-type alpha-1,6-glucosidase [Anaerolineales bacterium]